MSLTFLTSLNLCPLCLRVCVRASLCLPVSLLPNPLCLYGAAFFIPPLLICLPGFKKKSVGFVLLHHTSPTVSIF